MRELAAQSLTRLLTRPYRRGAETLVIPLGADAGGATTIAPYDFREYRARYQADPPEPKYVIFPLKDVGRDEVEIEVTFSLAGVPQAPSLVAIPAHTFAGVSFVIPLPAGADASLRLLSFRLAPAALPGAGADNWGIVTFLGNIAKLAWALGREKDLIRAHLRDTQKQRRRAVAHGFSLDQLGEDLRVPRFPPREHSFDADTIALYHLNDLVPNNGAVADETARFGLPGVTPHPGVNRNAQSGATGKFGRGFSFSAPNTFIEIPHHADFDLPANRGFTAEAFIKAEPASGADPRFVILKGAVNAAGALTGPGWSLALVGGARGINNNARWAVREGANVGELFADLDLADGKFHHLAGVLDREQRRARLFVDGAERAAADISAFGAIANAEPIRIARSALAGAGHQFTGVIDEVRLSRVARADFHPVLGESDEAYRQRLGIFEQWRLPTPDQLLQAINGLVQINGQPDSFVMVEKDRPTVVASKLARVLPATLPAGQSIDRDGDQRSQEAAVSGAPNDDVDFKEIFLFRHDRPNVVYGVNENNRRMQAATKRALDHLLSLLAAATPPIAGPLIIEKSFDPADTGLHRAGRALRLRHQTLPPQSLAVQAHRAGFDFVRNDGTQVYASVRPGEKLEIVVETAAPAAGIDLFTGQRINLHVAPEALPGGGLIKWTLIPCGAGRARFEPYEQTALSGAVIAAATTITVTSASGFPPSPPFKIRIDDEVMNVTAMAATTWTVTRGIDETTPAPHALNAAVILAVRTPLTARPRLRLAADAPGEIALRVEFTFQRQTVAGARTIRIGIASLNNNETIAASGAMNLVEEKVVGKPGETINPIYLITSNAPVNFGADPNNRRMQLGLEQPFNRLVELLAADAANLQVLKSFDPADAGLHKAGRAMRLRHAVLDQGRLGALAHQAGFDFVRRQGPGGNEIYCSVAPGEKIEIARAADLKPLGDELTVGSAADLRARFSALPPSGGFNWSLTRAGLGQGSFDFVLRPQVKFTPRAPGWLSINVTYLETDPQSTPPYTFEIKLKASLDTPGVIIPKHQYDLIMNILNYFHPIGVEVVTEQIRKHVVEVEQDPLKAFPAYTYPDFRR